MNFLLQKDTGCIDIDIQILHEELHKQRWNHTHSYATLNEMMQSSKEIAQAFIPVGTIEFVKQWLKKVHSIEHMHPIEIPLVLRTDNILKRDYRIIPKEELPKTGYYFTKYVSELKYFTHIGEIETLHNTSSNQEPFLKDGLYQVSEVVPIIAEYRIFVYNDKIVAIYQYDGKPNIYPESTLIDSMISQYMRDLTRPKAYTMDIAIINGRGTALLEIHPWVSVGLYGYMFGSCLPYCYWAGLDWYITQNQPLERWVSA